jgi:hypothetical protein
MNNKTKMRAATAIPTIPPVLNDLLVAFGSCADELLPVGVDVIELVEGAGQPYSAMEDFCLLTSTGKSDKSVVCQSANMGLCHAFT